MSGFTSLSKRVGVAAFGLCLLSGPALAGGTQSWKTTSDVLAVGLPVLAGLATLNASDTEGLGQLALSGGSAVLVTEVLKHVVHSTRPDGSDNQSFPSGHTAVAFAAVRFIDKRYGERVAAYTPWLYGAAALTGVARVEADKHHWGDVLVGAAIGFGASQFWAQPIQGGQLSVLPMPHGVAVSWARTF